MRKRLLLRIAAFFIFFTFAGHTFGVFAPIPQGEIEALKTIEVMKQSLAPMPFGPPKTYFDVLLGSKICLSVYLLVSSILFVLLSRNKPGGSDAQVLIVTSIGLLMTGVLSLLYFFPLPAICLAIASFLGFFSSRLKS